MEDQSTASWTLFRQSAEGLATKLSEVHSGEAIAMTREARDLASVFQAWDVQRPTNDSRVAAIQQLFDLNRRAMDFLSKQARPSVRTPPPSNRR